MALWESYGLDEFLAAYPRLQLKDGSSKELVIEGEHRVFVEMPGYLPIDEMVHIRIVFPESYPRDVPKVFDLGSSIPKNPDHHVNSSDNSLCLGSGIRVLHEIGKDPSIEGFLKSCVNNYLYRILYKKKYDLIPGDELKHGEEGLIQDYEAIFGISGKDNVVQLLKVLAKRKRIANKMRCPCGCGLRLGRCRFRFKLIAWRRKSKRAWFALHLSENFSQARYR